MGDNLMDLPPGFRFHPTDEEIITHYLRKKVVNKTFSSIAIGEADLNRCEPWNLPSKAKMGEKEWYFFCKRDKKYPTGTRTNRATESGYWKATGKDKEIFYRGKSSLVGMKKTLVFYLGRAPKGQKTNWVMHEYRLEGKLSGYDPPGTSNDEWVICRVFHKSKGPKTRPSPELERTDSFGALLSSADDRFTYNGDGMAVKASSTAMLNPSYLASTMPMEYPRDPQRSFFTNNNGELCSGFPSQEAILCPQGAVGLPGQLSPSSANAGYMHQDRNLGFPSQTTATAFRSHTKVEQYSNPSFVSVSQDTGLSTDMNTETSSVISRRDVGVSRSYNDPDYPPSSATPADDYISFWEY